LSAVVSFANANTYHRTVNSYNNGLDIELNTIPKAALWSFLCALALGASGPNREDESG